MPTPNSYCGSPWICGEEILFTKDHIIPRAKGGGNDLNNLQTFCALCNQKKGSAVKGRKIRIPDGYDVIMRNGKIIYATKDSII